MGKKKVNYVHIGDFTPILATREDVEKIKAILMDISAQIAELESGKDGFNCVDKKWFTEISKAIRVI